MARIPELTIIAWSIKPAPFTADLKRTAPEQTKVREKTTSLWEGFAKLFYGQ